MTFRVTSDFVHLSPDVFRPDPVAIRLVTPDVGHLYRSILGRLLRTEGVLLDIDPPLGPVHPFSVGGQIKIMIRCPFQTESFEVEGHVTRVLRNGTDPEGRRLSLLGMKFGTLSLEARRKLEAHRLASGPIPVPGRSLRIPCRFLVDARGMDVMSPLAVTDLSMTGMFVSSKARFQVGKRMHLSFRLPFQTERVSLGGRVVWQGEKPILGEKRTTSGFGFQFLDIPQNTHAALASYYARSTVSL